uniref:RanBP2-type domain-containing protein n=1 Tax=Solanum lycopersicum TaxID=4081 RepID=A0A3Q7GJ45_SOLLC
MSQGITLLPEKSLLLFFNYERPYYQEYAVGFSGVLFAMKIILNAQSHDYTYVHGLLVPTRYAAWAELILIQMFVPGVSFLGHLGAILAGLLFLCLKASYSGANPLRTIIRGFGHALNWPLMFMNCLFRRQIIGGRGTVGGRQTRDTSQMWRCQGCTFDNSGWLNVCDMCSTSRTDDVLSSLSSTDEVQDLSLDELRHRRIQRYVGDGGGRVGSKGVGIAAGVRGGVIVPYGDEFCGLGGTDFKGAGGEDIPNGGELI